MYSLLDSGRLPSRCLARRAMAGSTDPSFGPPQLPQVWMSSTSGVPPIPPLRRAGRVGSSRLTCRKYAPASQSLSTLDSLLSTHRITEGWLPSLLTQPIASSRACLWKTSRSAGVNLKSR